MPKSVGARDAALFDAAADFEWLRGAAIELHCSFVSLWKDSIMLCS